MGSAVKLLFILIAVGFLGLWFYLSKYATKADVFAWERSFGIEMPLWMKQLPKTTGEINEKFSEGKAAWSGEVAEWKASAKTEFNSWLEDLKNDAKEAAKKEANEYIDKQFGGTGSTGNK